MATFECTFEQFKRVAKDFHDNAPTLNAEELESAWSCLSLHYLGMFERAWVHSAAIVLKMETKTYITRRIEIESQLTDGE